MNQPIIQPSTDRQWMEYYQKKLKEAEVKLRVVLNLYKHDDAFVARKGLHWAYVDVCEELRAVAEPKPLTDASATGDAVESAAEVRKAALLAAAEHIRSTWGRAYEEDLLGGIFRELPRGQGGVSDEARTRISAMMGRHMAKRIVEDLTSMAHLNDEDFTEAFTALDIARSEQSSTGQARTDTARLDWLQSGDIEGIFGFHVDIREAIDAAIASTGKEKKG